MHAEVRLEEDMRVYVRRDSQAVIRKRFGVAGDSYLDISRGTGEPLDWAYAVITASLDRPPTENIGAMVDEVKQKVLPIIDETRRAVQLLASTMERLERGEGTVGGLLADDRLIRDLETTAANAEKSLAAVQTITRDLARATPQIARNVEETSENLPMVVRQARATTAELQQLVVQLRGHWLLGRDPEGTATRLPSTAVRP
jgi:phospholipid/cholesterol/gamma-HCH transport system substrate-binding protein